MFAAPRISPFQHFHLPLNQPLSANRADQFVIIRILDWARSAILHFHDLHDPLELFSGHDRRMVVAHIIAGQYGLIALLLLPGHVVHNIALLHQIISHVFLICKHPMNACRIPLNHSILPARAIGLCRWRSIARQVECPGDPRKGLPSFVTCKSLADHLRFCFFDLIIRAVYARSIAIQQMPPWVALLKALSDGPFLVFRKGAALLLGEGRQHP